MPVEFLEQTDPVVLLLHHVHPELLEVSRNIIRVGASAGQLHHLWLGLRLEAVELYVKFHFPVDHNNVLRAENNDHQVQPRVHVLASVGDDVLLDVVTPHVVQFVFEVPQVDVSEHEQGVVTPEPRLDHVPRVFLRLEILHLQLCVDDYDWAAADRRPPHSVHRLARELVQLLERLQPHPIRYESSKRLHE